MKRGIGIFGDMHYHCCCLQNLPLFLAPVAAVLGLFWFSEAYRQTSGKPFQYIAPMCLLGGCGLLMLWQILPVNMVQYNMRIEHIENYPYNVLAHFPEAFFAGENTMLNLT